MQVYAVIAGIDCEGEMFDTLRLFDCHSTAVEYYTHLIDDDGEGYHYAMIQVREVNLESAFCTA